MTAEASGGLCQPFSPLEDGAVHITTIVVGPTPTISADGDRAVVFEPGTIEWFYWCERYQERER